MNTLFETCRALAILTWCGAAVAQTHPASPPRAEVEQLAQAVIDTTRELLFGDDDTLAFAAGELRHERIASGAPYCAEAVHETVQWLPDASGGALNRIVRKQSTRLCRDGEGRTRQEVERGGRPLIYLRDPLARESWVLDPQRKTAQRIGAGGSGSRMEINIDHSMWREYADRMRSWAGDLARSMRENPPGATPAAPPAPPAPPTPPTPPTPPVPPTAPLAPTGTGFGVATSAAPVIIHRSGDGEREVRLLRLGDGQGAHHAAAPPPMPVPPMPPGVSWRAQTLAPRGPGVVTPLPAKEIEGVRANGERTTWTIEAGKIGNERPIKIVREIWTSPELLLTLSTRDFDPRSGEVNYQLRNLRRGEPDAALMRVPADYSTGRSPRAPKPGASGPAARS